MQILLIITILILTGCGSMGIDNFYHKSVKADESKRINKQFNKVKFDGNISKFEAEAIFDKYVLDNGWPWKMMGGNTKPIDIGDFWAIKYMSDIGLVVETAPVVLIDKKTGEVTIKEEKG